MPNCTTLWSHLEAGEVHNGFDKDGVIADVRVLGVKLGERAEERTAAGDVHLAHRPLERGGCDIRSKGIDDVLPVALVQQHQSHLEVRPDRDRVYMFSSVSVSDIYQSRRTNTGSKKLQVNAA